MSESYKSTTCCCSHFLGCRSTNTSAPIQVFNKVKVGLWLHCVWLSHTPSYLKILDPIHNHALCLCLGAFRTSRAVRLCVQATEPPLALRRKKLALQYCLKLSANTNNPAYNAVFNSKFKTQFDNKLSQTRPLGFRVKDDLQNLGFKDHMQRFCTFWDKQLSSCFLRHKTQYPLVYREWS